MKLYKEVLIESAEQAEALPVGTLATRLDQVRARQILTRTDSRVGPWEMDMRGYRHALVVGFTALVPIEAEEEVLHRDTFASSEQLRRYVTPWQRFTEGAAL